MLSRDMFCREKLGLNSITYCMTVILNVFCPFMEDRVLGERDCRLVVNPNHHLLHFILGDFLK